MKAASGFRLVAEPVFAGFVGQIVIGALVLAAGLVSIGIAQAASSQDPDWPCVQRMVPNLSVGTVWRGPSLQSIETDWQSDAAMRTLVAAVSARRTPLDEAREAIKGYASGLGSDNDARLTALFAGIFETIDKDRETVIRGIKKYARRQRALGEKIAHETVELEELRGTGTAETETVLEQLSERLNWDIRIFEDRERSLAAVCEQPVLLEQRLFALAREIMAHLK